MVELMQGWLVACIKVDFFFLLYSGHHLLQAPAKVQRDTAAKRISHFLLPALWHNSHLTLILHLSEAKTCLVFDSKPLAIFDQLLTGVLALQMACA